MAENMPSSTAQRPGDVLTQYGGITVEVLNTDAEGRLILADAIVRACEDNPDYLIETSTLTGAQTVALGARIPGVMGSDEFRDRVAAISQQVGENGWPMPLPDELKDDLKSTVADLANISGQRFAGMLVAGVFLREFVADGVSWAHIDVAGPAYNTGSPWGYYAQGRHRCADPHHVRGAGRHRRERLDRSAVCITASPQLASWPAGRPVGGQCGIGRVTSAGAVHRATRCRRRAAQIQPLDRGFGAPIPGAGRKISICCS